MALAIIQLNKNVPGDSFEIVSTLVCDNSYPPGGYTITPQQLGYASFIRRVVGYDPANWASAAVRPVITPIYNGKAITSLKLQLQVLATGAEVAGAVNVSAYTFSLTTEGV